MCWKRAGVQQWDRCTYVVHIRGIYSSTWTLSVLSCVRYPTAAAGVLSKHPPTLSTGGAVKYEVLAYIAHNNGVAGLRR